jgi:hypothetical protein
MTYLIILLVLCLMFLFACFIGRCIRVGSRLMKDEDLF